MQFQKFSFISLKPISIISGPLLAVLILLFVDLDPERPQVTAMLAIVVWMAIWWIFQAIPLGITALLPLVLYPVLGILPTAEVAPVYMNHIIFLFIGGFLVAFALERWNLHKRIALFIISIIGFSPARLLAGFMLSSWILSMFLSNSATTIMLIAPALAVIKKIEDTLPQTDNNLATGLLLGIAYAASIGGAATLVGSPPNLIFLGLYNQYFPQGIEIGFSRWFLFGFPISLVFITLAFIVLKKMFLNFNFHASFESDFFVKEYKSLGKATYEEKVVLTAFIILAILWFSRADLDIGIIHFSGWAGLFKFGNYIQDSTVAIFIALLLFLIPAKKSGSGMILSWNEAKKIPLQVIFLFGGGFALAYGFNESGLSQYLAGQLGKVSGIHILLLVSLICFIMIFLTEISSNTATTQLILPILIVLTGTINAPPYLLLIPATIAASYAFMLPVATPPNTIIFGSERVNIQSMVKAGIVLNIIGIVLITLFIFTLGKWVFGGEF